MAAWKMPSNKGLRRMPSTKLNDTRLNGASGFAPAWLHAEEMVQQAGAFKRFPAASQKPKWQEGAGG